MSVPLLCLASVLASAPPVQYPVPPVQTKFQHDLVQRVRAAAEPASAAATPLLLAALDAAPFRAALTACCADHPSGVANESAPQLLARLREEVRVAELTHNFNANSSGSWEGDVNITTAAALPYLPNLWSLQFLNLTEKVSQREEDLAEVYIMGFTPFDDRGGAPVGAAAPPDFASASARPLYVAHNMLGLATGNPTFGDVAMVLRPSVVQPMALVAPVDTGNWEDACNATSGAANKPPGGASGPSHGPPKKPPSCRFPFPLNCSAWSPHAPAGAVERQLQGVFGHLDHVLLANARLWESRVPGGCTDGLLARVFARIYGGRDGTPATTAAQELAFLEPNLAGTAVYPGAVKALVADFGQLFGTALGAQVRALASRWGWVLLWGLGPDSGPGSELLDQRAVDPAVLAATSASASLPLPAAVLAAFNATWAAAEAAGGAGGRTPEAVAGWWSGLPAAARVSVGFRAGQCPDANECVAVAQQPAGVCVCYAAAAAAAAAASNKSQEP